MLERFVGRSPYANCGQRVVAGQRLMQATSDIFLGWERVVPASTARARLLRPPAQGLEGLHRDEAAVPAGAAYGSCAAGRSPAPTPAPATGSHRLLPRQSDTFDQAIAAFAETYADQNERDYPALKEAVDSGRVKAETGLNRMPQPKLATNELG